MQQPALEISHLARNQNARIHQKASAVYLLGSFQAIFRIRLKPLQTDMEALLVWCCKYLYEGYKRFFFIL